MPTDITVTKATVIEGEVRRPGYQSSVSDEVAKNLIYRGYATSGDVSYADAAEEQEGGDGVDLSSLTVSELDALAEERGVALPTSALKAEKVAILGG